MVHFLIGLVFPIHHRSIVENSTCYDSYDLRYLLPAALLLCILNVKDLYKMGLL